MRTGRELAPDAGARRRHNAAMGRRRRSPLPRILLLAGLLPACQSLGSAGSLAEGDRLFQVGDFQQARDAYAEAVAAGGGREAEKRLEAATYRFYAEGARTLLHLSEPGAALEALEYIETRYPGRALTRELVLRARREMAQDLADEGRDLFDDQPAEAADRYLHALAWDPDNREAREGLALAQERAAGLERLGRMYYHRGLEELDGGHTVRARTSFQHATGFWGEDTRPGKLFRRLSHELAEESLRRARLYLDQGLDGPAWLALRDADNLEPGREEVQRLLVTLEARMRARDELSQADMAVRGGRIEEAERLLTAAREDAGDRYQERETRIRLALERERLRQRYLGARAAELEGQVVAAAQGYREILEASGDPSFLEVGWRLRSCERRIAAAEAAYRQALAAEQAGDRDAYRENLAEVLRQAADYADAAARFQTLFGEGEAGSD